MGVAPVQSHSSEPELEPPFRNRREVELSKNVFVKSDEEEEHSISLLETQPHAMGPQQS